MGGIVGFRHDGAIRVGLAELQTGGGMECPGGFIVISALARVGSNLLRCGAEGAQGDHIAQLIVAEAGGLQGSTPLRYFATECVVECDGGVVVELYIHVTRQT